MSSNVLKKHSRKSVTLPALHWPTYIPKVWHLMSALEPCMGLKINARARPGPARRSPCPCRALVSIITLLGSSV